MESEQLIQQLEASVAIVTGAVSSVTDEQARWKPAPERWSILEVLNHLVDEERDDFRTRLKNVLDDSPKTWDPIDPEGWAVERGYNERELSQTIADFKSERETSLEWLGNLDDPHWDNEYHHPAKAGRIIKAGDLLSSWAAHDRIHIRQIAQISLEYVSAISKPYSVRYASP